MAATSRFRPTPFLAVGFLWLIIGLTNPKLRAFIGIGAAFMALGIKRKPTNPAPLKTGLPSAAATEATAE